MPDNPTTPGMQEIVLRLARHRRGLAFLHLVDVESDAVTLGPRPASSPGLAWPSKCRGGTQG